MSVPFSPEEDEKILFWADQGLSGRQIGKKLKRSRNAIVGRAYRLSKILDRPVLKRGNQFVMKPLEFRWSFKRVPIPPWPGRKNKENPHHCAVTHCIRTRQPGRIYCAECNTQMVIGDRTNQDAIGAEICV